MNWLMDLAAPRTGTAAAVKGSIFMVLIHLLNFAVTVGIRGGALFGRG